LSASCRHDNLNYLLLVFNNWLVSTFSMFQLYCTFTSFFFYIHTNIYFSVISNSAPWCPWECTCSSPSLCMCLSCLWPTVTGTLWLSWWAFSRFSAWVRCSSCPKTYNKSKQKVNPNILCARREKDIQHWDLHPVLHNPNDHELRQSERDYDHAFLQHVCDCPCNKFHDRRRDHQQIRHWSWWCKYKVTASHFVRTLESLCLPFGVTMVVSMIGRHVGNCYRCTLELK